MGQFFTHVLILVTGLRIAYLVKSLLSKRKINMAIQDLKILAKKIAVSILIYAIPLAILGGGLSLIKFLLTN